MWRSSDYAMNTGCDSSLIKAYEETEYRVTQGHPLVLRVDVPNPELASLYKAKGVSCAAFITACNPFSRMLSNQDNAKRQAELAAYLQSITVTDTKQTLFASQRSAAFTANSLTQIVCEIYRNAGIDGATSHTGRRTFLTNLAEKGVSTRVMMALAGHRNMATTQRYIDLRPGVLRNAVELV